MSNLLGALIGAWIDRQDGDSGIKGAIIGTVAETALRAAAPIVATYALGWAVQYGFRKSWHAGSASHTGDARTGALQGR